eukprot:COSAG01_NODE_6293_length_3751_cov_1.697700_6_plen_219_part_00
MAALVPISECQQLSIPLALPLDLDLAWQLKAATTRAQLSSQGGQDGKLCEFHCDDAPQDTPRPTHSMPGPCRSASQLAPQHHSGGRALAGEGGIRVNSWVSGGFLPPQVRGTKYEGLACAWDWCECFAATSHMRWSTSRAIPAQISVISQMCLAKRPSVSRHAAHTAPHTTDGTFSELAGVDPTDHRAAAAGLPPIDSHSLVPVLMGTGPSSRKEVRQ